MIKKRSLTKLIILSIVTLGIYSIAFWYGFTKDMNKACEEDGKMSPNYMVVILLSILSVGIYNFYWIYTQGQRLYWVASDYGIYIKENGSIILLWAVPGIFLLGIGPFVAAHILIKNLNAVASVYNGE